MSLATPWVSRRTLLAAAALAPAVARAQQQTTVIDVTRARTDPIPIAIPDLAGATGDAQRLGRDIARVVVNNLRGSGLFRPIDRQAYIQTPEAAAQTPRFQDWRVIGAQALVTGRTEVQPGGRLRVEFRLWDVLPETQLQGTAYTADINNWRQIAHVISDVIYERLLGERGYFDTRIAYISETGPRDRRTRRLAIMDQDGENHRFLTDGRFQALTPRFHSQRPADRLHVLRRRSAAGVPVRSRHRAAGGAGQLPWHDALPRFSPDGRERGARRRPRRGYQHLHR